MKIKFGKPPLPVLLLTVMIVLPSCAFGSSSFLTTSFQTVSLTKRAHCADIGALSPHTLKPPFILGNKKACFSTLNPPAPTTIMQTLPFIMSLVWQEASGISDFLFSPAGQSLAFAERLKKNSPAPEKVFQALTQNAVTDSNLASLGNQFRELIDNQQQLTKEKENPSSLYIAIINEELRLVVVPGQVIPELLFNTIRHWLLDAEFALYLRILPEADWLELQPELETIVSVSPASAAAGDDGDPDREPDNNPEPALFIAGEFGIEPWPWLTGLYPQAVLQKQQLLNILRQRTRQAIARGNHDLAQILHNRIMVIEADLSDLENSASQVSDNLALQALLLEGLLANTDEVRVYATRDLTVEAPVDSNKRSVSGRGGATSQNQPSKNQALTVSDGKPGSSHQGSGSSDDDPKPKQLQHTYNNQPCPVCKAKMCKEAEPGSATDLSIDSQCFILTLPTEILLYIFEYTNLSDRIAIMQCCRRFEEIAANEKQILIWFHKHTPDVLFPMGKAMSAALEVKTKGLFNNASLVVKRTLANFYEIAPSFCTHTLVSQRLFYKIMCIATFPDDRIVSGNLNGEVKVWRINEGGREHCIQMLPGHENSVTNIATLSDCWVISSCYEYIKVWNLKSPDGNYCTDTCKMHPKKVFDIKVLPDRWFYLSFYGEEINVWFLTEEGKALRKHLLPVPSEASCLKVFPDGQLFAGTFVGKIYFWKKTKGDEAPLTKEWRAYPGQSCITYIEMLPNGLLLTCSSKCVIKGWDLNNTEMPCINYCAHEQPFCGCVNYSKISPDGQMIICLMSEDIEIFTFKNGKLAFVCTQKKDDCPIVSLAFLQNGQMITCSEDGTIRVWDYADTRPSNNHKQKVQPPEHEDKFSQTYSASFAAGSDGRTALLRLWQYFFSDGLSDKKSELR